MSEDTEPNKECKMFTVVLKDFELHGKTFREGEMISFKDANYLLQTMDSVGVIKLDSKIKPKLETKSHD